MTTNKPEVKRYDMSACPEHICRVFDMQESEDGDYVEWEAYEALQAECEELREDAETERAIQRAAEVLPLGFSIEIEIEKDAGTVALFGPGPSVSCDFQGSLAEQINDAIDAAMQEARNP